MDSPKFQFEVASSSSGEIYVIGISRTDDNLTCTCTCAAGQRGTVCKHRLRILSGDLSDVISGDTSQAFLIPRMLEGTDVEKAMENLRRVEEEMEVLKRRYTASKKALARVLDN